MMTMRWMSAATVVLLSCGCSVDDGAVAPDADPEDTGVAFDSGGVDAADDTNTDLDTGGSSTSDSRVMDTAIGDTGSPTDTGAPDAGWIPLLIEAEDYDRIEDNDTHGWVLESSHPGHSGRGYMIATPTMPYYACEDVDACGAVMEYDFRVDTDEDYQFHFRTSAPSGGSDSFHWATDGDAATINDVDQTDAWGFERATGSPVRLGVGDHTLFVWMRENGVRIDQIYIARASDPGPP